MIAKEAVVNSNLGLHAKTTKEIVKTAEKFQSLIEIEYNGMKANAKSLISILSLGIGEGEKIKLIVSGTDEPDAVDALLETIRNLHQI